MEEGESSKKQARYLEAYTEYYSKGTLTEDTECRILREYKQLRKRIEEKELEVIELLECINSMENRFIFLYVGIFIMFMGLR